MTKGEHLKAFATNNKSSQSVADDTVVLHKKFTCYLVIDLTETGGATLDNDAKALRSK
jgi:hypothetical protein